MASKKIEQELTRILNQIEGYTNRHQVEELSYLVGQVDNEERACLIVQAVNLFPEMLEVLGELVGCYGLDGSLQVPNDESSKARLAKARSLLAKVKKE